MAARQAIVVIHGMGEQRPLATLRSFITAAVPAPPAPDPAAQAAGTAPKPLYWSKPDAFGDKFELRRFVVAETEAPAGGAGRPITDVFEYYWADKMTGTKLRQLRPLAKALLRRLPWQVPANLVAFYVLGWLLLITLLSLAIRLANSVGPVALLDGVDVLKKVAEGQGKLTGWLIVAVLVVTGAVTTFAVNTFGDVARYLDAAPDNVGVRHSIKADGLDMLKRIQDSGAYDRMIVVGHSLGSVIALDLLSYLWGDEYSRHNPLYPQPLTALDRVQQLGPMLSDKSTPAELEQYRLAQRELWLEQRRRGSPWLITDLISAGSPLTHAALLLAPSADKLRERQFRYELMTDPPQPDDGVYSHPAGGPNASSYLGKVRVLNSGAMFACTRWTNIWFPCRFGLFGDPFGGPLRSLFGYGIADLPITAGPNWRFIPVLPHVSYWRGTSGTPAESNIALVRAALDLDSSQWLADPPPRP